MTVHYSNVSLYIFLNMCMIILIKSTSEMAFVRNFENSLEQDILSNMKEGNSERYARQAPPPPPPKVLGIRVETFEGELKFIEKNVPAVLAETVFTLRVFGYNIDEDTILTVTKERGPYGGTCIVPAIDLVKSTSNTETTALYDLKLPKGDHVYYICAQNEPNYKVGKKNLKPLVHMGDDIELKIASYDRPLPVWLIVLFIIILLCFSALFSGLNLGMMALDPTELKIICKTGSEKESKYARTIWPVRRRGNFLLCSILLGNVLVNSTLTILIGDISTGEIAVAISTIIIVIFGEIVPQAICTKYGLLVGAKTIWITKIFMVITSPLSYPISKILDCILGEDIGKVYDREKIRELVNMSAEDGQNLNKTEVNIISGALEMRKKTVGDVMTPLNDCFLIPITAILDFATVSEIMRAGYSRIPVYQGERGNIVTILYIKDLAFVDTDDFMPLKALCDFYQNKVLFVNENVTINVIYDKFRTGEFGHLAVVQAVRKETADGKEVNETVGIATLEDVIEELLQEEIVDETDIFTDNRNKIRRPNRRGNDFIFFANKANPRIQLSPQLTLVALQYLSASVPPFHSSLITENVLKHLLEHNVVHQIRKQGKSENDPSLYIYEFGKPSNEFVVLIEGHVQIQFGDEKLFFESGPFHYFGIQILENVDLKENDPEKKLDIYISNYSIKALTDVTYLGITRRLYKTALRASQLDSSRRIPLDEADEDLREFLEKTDISDSHSRKPPIDRE